MWGFEPKKERKEERKNSEEERDKLNRRFQAKTGVEKVLSLVHFRKKEEKKLIAPLNFSSSLFAQHTVAMPRFSVGLDVGTQGAKAVVFDLESKKVVSRGELEKRRRRRRRERKSRGIGIRDGVRERRATFLVLTSDLDKTSFKKNKASRSYGLLPTTVQGRAEQDPATWLSEGFAACKEAVSKLDENSRKSIAAVGVSGQQHGSVFLDSAGRVLRPAKLWCDTETAVEAEALSSKMKEAVVPAFTAPKVAWLAANEPATAEKVSCVCLPHDYVNMVLSGDSRPVSEAGDASGTGYWDVEKREFDLRKAAMVDARLPSWLPALSPSPDAAVGSVCAAAAELTGLPVGIPVAPGSGDNACAALGVGAVVPGEFDFVWTFFFSFLSKLFFFASKKKKTPSFFFFPFFFLAPHRSSLFSLSLN